MDDVTPFIVLSAILFTIGAVGVLTRQDLLAYLAARPGQVVSRRELVEAVWRQPAVGGDERPSALASSQP
jgi:hypothetical protein